MAVAETGKKKEDSAASSSGNMAFGGGSNAPIAPIGGGITPMDRVAQVQAIQAMSPFAQVKEKLNVDVGKDFELNRQPFEERKAVMQGIWQSVSSILGKAKTKNFGQHIENITFKEGGLEKPRHNFFGEANTRLFSPAEVMKREGGLYVDDTRFKPPEKGRVE